MIDLINNNKTVLQPFLLVLPLLKLVEFTIFYSKDKDCFLEMRLMFCVLFP